MAGLRSGSNYLVLYLVPTLDKIFRQKVGRIESIIQTFLRKVHVIS